MVKIQVPATTANIGSGFDILGACLNLYNYIDIEISDLYNLSYSGKEYKSSLSPDKDNLFYTSLERVYKEFGVKVPEFNINIEVNIPLSRGVGSSSSAIVSGVYSANYFLGNKLSNSEMLRICNDIEGHPDNVAPCLLGGVIISMSEYNKVYTQKIKPKNNYKFIVVVPEFELSTKEARKVLPEKISFSDSIFNSSHLAFLIMSLINGDDELLKISLNDRLHEQYRGKLIKGFDDIKKIAVENGAIGSVLSGAGPTILAIANKNEENIAKEMQKKWLSFGVNSTYKILDIDKEGCRLLI
ncbi:MAG: homoserine kinase [Candidatus Sericytochromatia bacterium]